MTIPVNPMIFERTKATSGLRLVGNERTRNARVAGIGGSR